MYLKDFEETMDYLLWIVTLIYESSKEKNFVIFPKPSPALNIQNVEKGQSAFVQPARKARRPEGPPRWER